MQPCTATVGRTRPWNGKENFQLPPTQLLQPPRYSHSSIPAGMALPAHLGLGFALPRGLSSCGTGWSPSLYPRGDGKSSVWEKNITHPAVLADLISVSCSQPIVFKTFRFKTLPLSLHFFLQL